MFIWRKPVREEKVALPAEPTSVSVYMRKRGNPLHQPTVLDHALIVSFYRVNLAGQAEVFTWHKLTGG